MRTGIILFLLYCFSDRDIISDWYNSLSYINKTIYVYVNINVDMNVNHMAIAIQDLREMRNLNNFDLFDHTQIEQFIQYLCTKQYIKYSIHS